ncbi:MAG: hypothetical protein K940chlam7_00050 [Chlamydiae bacterium]|nr:hypothetical protein [Chlamydiota bacterium]
MNVISAAMTCPNILMKGPRPILETISFLAKKIYELTLHYFNMLQNLVVVAFGGKEMLADFVSTVVKAKGRTSPDIDRGDFYSPHVRKVQNALTEFSLIHGLFYLGSGIAGAGAATHELQWLNLGLAYPVFQYVSSGLFLYVNLFSLEKNIQIYYHAHKMAETATGEKLSFANRLKLSAVMGIINNIGYVLATLFTFFPGTYVAAIVLACFSIFVGSVKIIYDYFCITPKISEHT